MSKAKNRLQELRGYTLSELRGLHQEAVKQLFVLKNQVKLSKEVKQPHLFYAQRKEIARFLTLIGEKSREQVEV